MKEFRDLLNENKYKPIQDFCRKYKLNYKHLKPMLPLGKPTKDNIIKASMFLMFLEDLPLNLSGQKELLNILEELGYGETLKVAKTLNNMTENMKIEGLEEFNLD